MTDIEDKVTILNGHTALDDQKINEIEQILEQMLQFARSGEIVAIAIAGVYSGTEDDICHVFHKPDGDPPPTRLIGALEVLKRSVLDHYY